jgi:hypothetical protein
VNRLAVLFLPLFLLLACSSEPPHSQYLVVTFQPGTAALTDTGTIALDNAVRQVREDRPDLIEIAAVVPAANSDPGGLVQARTDIVSRALLSTGLKDSVVHVNVRPADAKEYAPRKDSLLIRIGYGVKAEP